MSEPRSVRRFRMTPVGHNEQQERTLIDRYLGWSSSARKVEYSGVSAGLGPNATVHLVDTSNSDGSGFTTRRPTLWHVLWIHDEASATATISSVEQHDTWPIAPGDSVYVPFSATLQFTGNQLALAIAAPEDSARGFLAGPPTHGIDRFFGHNRRTTSFLFGGLDVSRWKITEPLSLAEHLQEPSIVITLAGKPVVRTPSAIETLPQGRAALIRPDVDPVIAPDGLAYLLVVAARASSDVVDELRTGGTSPDVLHRLLPRSPYENAQTGDG